MTVTAGAKSGILGFALQVVLNGDARPMIHGVGESVMAGLPADNDPAFAGSLGHGRDSGQTSQSGVIAPLQGIPSLCKQRGEDDPSNSRQGCEDLHVMLLGLLFLRALCRNKLGSKSVQLAMGLFDLPVQKADAPDERLDVGAGGFGRSGGNLHRWLAQHLQDMGSVEAPDTITFQQLGYGSLADARGLARRGDEFPQIEQPLGDGPNQRNLPKPSRSGGSTRWPRFVPLRFTSLGQPRKKRKA